MAVTPVAIVGGVTGGILLLFVNAQVFRVLVPFLILLASFLLAVQDRVRNWIKAGGQRPRGHDDGTAKALIPVGFTAVYGGYFGAGQSVIILSVLGIFLNDTSDQAQRAQAIHRALC